MLAGLLERAEVHYDQMPTPPLFRKDKRRRAGHRMLAAAVQGQRDDG